VSRRLLFLLPFPPDPAGLHGSSRLAGQLLERLAQRHEVGALFLRAPDEPAIAAELQDRLALAVEVQRPSLRVGIGVRRAARRTLGLAGGRPLWATDWRVPELERRVREIAASWRPDVVQAELPVMGQYLAALPEPRPARVLVEYDPGAAAAADLAATERGLRRAARLADAAAWRRYGRRLAGDVDAVVTFTEEDAALLGPLSSGARLVRIAPGIALPPTAADPVGVAPPRVLFVGSFVHPPNVDAAIRLAESIFPAVRARVPSARLELVGDQPPAAVRRLAGAAVDVTGYVPDTRPHVDAAAVVAAPLGLGGGMRLKVLEALAAGKAVVATPRAVAGLDLEPGTHAVVADGDAELGDALVELLENPARRRRIGSAARDFARERLDWRHTVAAYERLYDSLERDR
jgi:glycosyltransferase involved in cell wall biosynthesis